MSETNTDSKMGVLQSRHMQQLAIPQLLDGDRIEDWEPAFKAAVASCLLAEGGERFVVGLLPAYVKRRPAEVELVRELIKDGTGLDDAFQSLKTLDPPVDKYEYMQKLCRMNWMPGTQVDDFFYQLKRVARHAEAKIDFVCSILCAQLPKEVQGKAKSWLADNTVSEKNARELLVKVKSWMVERGIPLDTGFKNLDSYGGTRSATVMSCSVPISSEEGASLKHASCPEPPSSASASEMQPLESVARVAYPGHKKQPPARRQSGPTFKGKCYVCGGNHMMKQCPDKRCPRCGAKGHILMNCSASKVSCVQPDVESPDTAAAESAVLLSVKLNGQSASAMVDSGAGPNVIDKGTMLKLGLLRSIKRQESGHVLGVGNTKVPVFGQAELDVELDDGMRNRESFTVLDSYDDAVLLGRSFLSGFPSVEFDWAKHRIRLGDSWYDANIMLSGGKVDARVDVVRLERNAPENLEFDINPALSPEKRQKLHDLLRKYSSVWAVNPKKPSLCTMGRHKIVTRDADPVKQKMRRMSPSDEKEVDRQVQEMLSNGICRPSDSPWSSGVILVKKRDGSQRFVIDYRLLNSATEKDAYPLPNAKDLFDKMHGSKLYSFLDCASAYWSIEMDERDRHKTAFSVPRGQFEMNVMAFGLCNSQSTYQRTIDSVLKGASNIVAYIDDVCCFSLDFEQHLHDLEQALSRLQAANMQLRPDKCHFGYEKGQFLGHMISAEGCSPLPANIEAIRDCPRPTSKKELQRFLGMVNYYRSFIPRMADTAAPLYALTRLNVAWYWSEECEQSFSRLRNILTSDMVLMFPQWEKPFYVEVDGSAAGVGAILSQEDAGGRLRPLAFFSSGLTATQQNYSASEIECWAMISATRKWSVYVNAAPKVFLISDHNPLTWLRRQRDPRRKFARWITELESLNYTVVYRKGVNHAAPDFLSRLESSVDVEVNDEVEHFERHVYSVEAAGDFLDEIRRAQQNDSNVMFALQQLQTTGKIRRGRYKNFGGMRVERGILMRKAQIVVPSSMRRAVFEREHSLHHAGVDKTYQSIRERYCWVGMYTYVQTMCTACDVCQRNKRSHAPKETLQEYDTGDTTPRTTIAMDVATLPWSEDGYRYFLVIVDLFSRYVELVPLKDQMAETVCAAVRSEWIHRHGPPLRIITDQAHNMDGQLMNQLCQSLGIEKRRSSPYHPEGDGLAERTIQSIKQLIRCKLQERRMEKTSWPSVLSEIRSIYNSLPNTSTRFQPNELMFGVKLRAPTGVGLERADDVTELSVRPKAHVQETQHCQSQLHDVAMQNLARANASSKQSYDRGKKDSDVRPGDYVFLHKEVRQSSLDPLYDGPFLVLKREDANVLLKLGSRDKVVHLNRCKKYVSDLTCHDRVLVPAGPHVEPEEADDVLPDPASDRRLQAANSGYQQLPLCGGAACQVPQLSGDDVHVSEEVTRETEVVDQTREVSSYEGRRNPPRNRRPPAYLDAYEL